MAAGRTHYLPMTLLVAPRFISTPVQLHWPWPSCSGNAATGARKPGLPITFRLCSWALACCGSAGSGSTPALRLSLPRHSPTRSWLAPPGMMAWLIMEVIRHGKATTLGMCSGVVAGLVAITPAATFVGTMSSIIFGLAAGVICFFAIQLKEKFGYDDSLDVVGHSHGWWHYRWAASWCAR